MLRIPDAQLEPLSWSALTGWAADDHAAAFAAMQNSCALLCGGSRRGKTRAASTGQAARIGDRDRRLLQAAMARICAKATQLGAP